MAPYHTTVLRGCYRMKQGLLKYSVGFRCAATSAKSPTTPKTLKVDQFANGTNANYLEELYNSWLHDRISVDPTWRLYFEAGNKSSTGNKPTSRSVSGSAAEIKNIEDHQKIQAIIRAYQVRGHLVADLDPLGIVQRYQTPSVNVGIQHYATKEVLHHHYTHLFDESNLNTPFKLPDTTMIGGSEKSILLKELYNRLENVYCRKIGIEYMHMVSTEKCDWVREQFEIPGSISFTPEEKKILYYRLNQSTCFEEFLAKKYPAEKRFGLEGCDMMIPCMKEIIDVSNEEGVDSVLIAMAHRGRLNTLVNVCRKPLFKMFTQFMTLQASDAGSGDVKYHLGTYVSRLNRRTKKNLKMTVVANPSHLEYVYPVMLGKARAEMFYRGDAYGEKVLPIVVHGDASFCGQGVVYESMNLSELPAYTTHGTIHIVINNQVGFTTDPRFSRSARYCTDGGRMLDAPIFHVNADDPEAVLYTSKVAAQWRAKFHRDVIIDLVGYRRNGHNEADQPMFTQPLMYQIIKKHKTCLNLYKEKLIAEKVFTDAEAKKMATDYLKICEDSFQKAMKEKNMKYSDWIDSPWPGFFEGRDQYKMKPTGVHLDVLKHIGKVFSSPPPDGQMFQMHKGIERILGLRRAMVKERIADWAIGEAFAIGTLLKDGIHVRLSGQDVERGTFSHRHHLLHHQTRDKATYNLLQHLYADQAPYTVCNSSLSECGILGFEHGYSMYNPNAVIIWEGQFGDFCNTAQTIIDQFICSGEAKWIRQSGIVMLLPHGLEGMGPEHSSCRVERFLQLSDDDPDYLPDISDCDFNVKQLRAINWFIANCTTPANLFHVLRRQVALPFRKPLVICTPKSLLRHPLARSPFKDMTECSDFKRIIPDEGKASYNAKNVKKLVFCSGKIYYDLFIAREERQKECEIAIARVEQICPFPYDLIFAELLKYPSAELIWAQEEHKNQGCWTYVQARFDTLLLEFAPKTRCITYHGRPSAAAPATGNKKMHKKEEQTYINSILGKLTAADIKRLEKEKKKAQEAAKPPPQKKK